MTLRTKTLIIISSILVTLSAVLLFLLSYILLDGFRKTEEEYVTRNTIRAREVLLSEINNLNSSTSDWGTWDETYTFASEQDDTYVERNLGDNELANLSINTLLLFNNNSQLVYGTSFDLAKNQKDSLSPDLNDHLTNNQFLLDHETIYSEKSGLLLLPDDIFLVASQPILTSEGEGPIAGSFIMGQKLNMNLQAKLTNQTQLSFRFYRLDTDNLSSNEQVLVDGLLASETLESAVFIQPISNEEIAGYTILSDVYGDPALVMKVTMSRDIYQQGLTSLRSLVFSMVMGMLVTIILVLVVMEKLVLSRLSDLSTQVVAIGKSGDINQRIAVPGKDELAQVGEAINGMLKDLQAALTREKALKQEVQKLRIEIDHVKKQQQVEEIVETDFFVDLQDKAKQMRQQKRRKPRLISKTRAGDDVDDHDTDG